MHINIYRGCEQHFIKIIRCNINNIMVEVGLVKRFYVKSEMAGSIDNL